MDAKNRRSEHEDTDQETDLTLEMDHNNSETDQNNSETDQNNTESESELNSTVENRKSDTETDQTDQETDHTLEAKSETDPNTSENELPKDRRSRRNEGKAPINYEKLHKGKTALEQNTLDKLKDKCNALREMANENKNRTNQATKENVQLKKDKTKADELTKKLQETVNQLKTELTEEKEKRREAEKHQENLTAEWRKLSENLDRMGKMKNELMERNKELEDTIKELRRENEEQKNQNTELETALAETQILIDNILDSHLERQEELEKLEASTEDIEFQEKTRQMLIADSNGRKIAKYLDSGNTIWTTPEDVYTTEHLLDYVKREEETLKRQDLIYICLGTNDVRKRKRSADTAENITSAMGQIQKWTAAKYLQPPPLEDIILNTEMAILQRTIQKKLPEDDYITNGLANQPRSKILSKDGIHITDAAAKTMAEKIPGNPKGKEPGHLPSTTKTQEVTETEVELNQKVAKYVIRRRRTGLDEIEEQTGVTLVLKTNDRDPICLIAIKGRPSDVERAKRELQKSEREKQRNILRRKIKQKESQYVSTMQKDTADLAANAGIPT